MYVHEFSASKTGDDKVFHPLTSVYEPKHSSVDHPSCPELPLQLHAYEGDHFNLHVSTLAKHFDIIFRYLCAAQHPTCSPTQCLASSH